MVGSGSGLNESGSETLSLSLVLNVILMQQIPGYHHWYGGPVPGGDTLPHTDGGLCADLPRASRQETESAGLGIELGTITSICLLCGTVNFIFSTVWLRTNFFSGRDQLRFDAYSDPDSGPDFPYWCRSRSESGSGSYQCCGSGMLIPDPDFYHHGSRIQKQQQKKGVKKIVAIFLFVATIITKLKIILFLMCWKKNLGQFSKNYRTFYPEIV